MERTVPRDIHNHCPLWKYDTAEMDHSLSLFQDLMEGKVFNLLVGSLIFLRKKRRLIVSRARQKFFFPFLFFQLTLKTFFMFSYRDLYVITLILNNIHFSHP